MCGEGGGDEGIDSSALFAFQGLGKGWGTNFQDGRYLSQSLDLDIDGRTI